ncbi:MAG: hypothetical protein CFE26_07115, partial [Verrucomicrobiales bacterium VVV1]
ATDRRSIGSFEVSHPAFSAFADKDRGDLAELPWQQRFTLGDNPLWHPLITLDNGVPLLWEKTTASSSGRALVLAHPLNREWNDLPREPLFVPFVKNLFACLARLDTAPPEARSLFPGLSEKRSIGFYVMPDESLELVVADPSEASVGSTDASRFRNAYGLPETGLPAAAAPPPPADAPEISRAREWWPWVAVALLGLLMMETWLATRQPAAVAK